MAGVFVGSIRDELCVLAGLGEGAEGVAEVVDAPGNYSDAGEEGEKADGGDEVAEALGGEDDEEDEDGLDDEEGLAARACVGVGGGGVSAWGGGFRGRRLLRAGYKVGNGNVPSSVVSESSSTIASMSIELRLLVDEAAGGVGAGGVEAGGVEAGGVEVMGSDASLIVGLASKKPLGSLSSEARASEARATAPPRRN